MYHFRPNYIYKYMLLIHKNQANVIVLTLTEKSTLTNPVFLFKLTNDLTKASKYFIAADTSSFTDRYNKFTVIDNTTELPLTGQINLKPTGFWKYEVYEQSSTTNLDPVNATTLLERGKAKVVGTETVYKAYNEQPKTYSVYGTGA